MAIAVLSRNEHPSRPPLAALRSILIASTDSVTRSRARAALVGLRWNVREAGGAAESIIAIEQELPEALILDTWLPDLELNEFTALIQQKYPALELVRIDGTALSREPRSSRRAEILAALRNVARAPSEPLLPIEIQSARPRASASEKSSASITQRVPIPGLIGSSRPMQALTEMIRLVAPRATTVLIEGQTGTGKEVVAHAIHSLSYRHHQPLVVLNCAAIPETLLEAELFGHTRGAFTGAVQSRMGRIETADGGTLFLDEIGEMPLALQAKMLRFLECGELQRVGDNTVSRVDVRVIAATHQPLEQRSDEGAFRLDLYHRLAVFPIEVPSLSERMDDLPELAEHFLDKLGHAGPRKRLSPDALEELLSHGWPGNVRELMHVLERGTILSSESLTIERSHIRIRRRPRT